MKVLNPFCFMFNTLAMGDVIASVPSVRWALQNWYTDTTDYLVCAKQMFRPLFHFVPESNWRDFDKTENSWDVPLNYVMATLNQKKDVIARNTPKHMHLAQYASIKMLDRILSADDLEYVPLRPVPIERFDLPKRYVVFVTSYRDATRAWYADYLLETARFCLNQGYEPVFIGKTDMNQGTSLVPKTSLPDSIPYGIDLRNKTSISELASIMAVADAVVGLDSGPIHLAGTTSVPIVCGYTSVSPEHRVPIRPEGRTIAIVPDIECIGCESKWASQLWNFENCYLGHTLCCAQMTSDKFIAALKTIL